MAEPTGVKRPDHPDFWILSETILALKADMTEADSDPAEQERRWRARYEEVGDFDSIAYAAIQCGLDLYGIETGADWSLLILGGRQESYIKAVQAFFDGFIMGASLVRKKAERE